MKNKKGTYLPFLFAIVLIAGIIIGSLIKKGETREHLLIYPRTDKINSLLNYIEQRYVDTISKKDITEQIIPHIIDNLDPHSVYIPAQDLQKFNEPLIGNFSGIGVQFNMINDTVIIVRTIPNGPSEKVGILAGDRIIKVNGIKIAGVEASTDSVVSKLRGPKGSEVNVTILRKTTNDTINFDIVRDDIPLYSIDVSYMLTDSIGYIKISKFSGTTFNEFMSAVTNLQSQGMNTMILDLRGNSGGYLNSAISIADQFLKEKNLIVYTEGRASPRKNFYATEEGRCLDMDVAILIDEWSASASEILAGAIQDNDRGIIVGRRSFGKGLVQDQTEFNDGSALRLTIARYYTPTGRCIQKPYENGNEEYFQDIHERIEHGELYNKDSITFADSLKFTTPDGNIVYGGGGIMPDIFVPADTVEITAYYAMVKNHGLIYRFAFDYTDIHRESLLSHSQSITDLDEYLNSLQLVDEFVRFAKEKGVKPERNEIDISKNLIEINIKAEIARHIFDNEGYYLIIKDVDNTLIKAKEALIYPKN